MGMFDYVNVMIDCPNCTETLKDSQTKSHDCLLSVLDSTEVDYFYTYCDCGEKITFERNSNRPYKEHRPTPFSLEEVKSLGFTLKVGRG